MNFQFSEEQQLLADSVAKLIERDYDFEARKTIIKSEQGYGAKVWQAIGEMGVIGLPVSEANGGFGMGAVAMIPLMDQIGRGLLVEPIVSTLLAARLIDHCGNQAETLAGVVSGEKKLAFAHGEAAMRYQWQDVAMKATGSGATYQLDGTKRLVNHAPMADQLVVSARTSGRAGEADGISLFLVDPAHVGVTMKTMRTIENFRAADIIFDKVPGVLIGAAGKAGPIIDEAIDFATMLTCAESLGAMSYANEATLDYLKSRKQFGVTIGSFQVLQHRMVDMTVCAEQARSITYMACDAIDKAAAGDLTIEERQHLVSAAKIKIADACRLVGQEAIQLHGGMGMTDEMKVSHTFKRLTMIGQLFGDVDHHLERFALTDR